MINILFISSASALNRAGTETFMMNVFRYLPHDEYHVDFLIFTDAETDYSKEIEAAGSCVWRLISRRNGRIKYYYQLNDFFHEHAIEYQAIHWCGNSLSSMAPIYYAWKYRIPIRIVHAHNSSASGLHNRLLHRLFRNIVYRITTHHLACSSAAAKWFFGDAKDAIIIKNGIDLDKYTYNATIREATRKRLNISEDTLVVGHIGRFCTEKNHAFLLQIFEQLLAIRPNSIMILIGKGELEHSIRQVAEKMGIASYIRFLGERTDIPELLQTMDCFVLPSTFEGLPFVLVEAQAAGLPCIVSDVVNKDIAITPNISFFSLKENPKKWAEYICKTISKYTRVDTYGSIAQAGYSAEESIRYLSAIYSHIQ